MSTKFCPLHGSYDKSEASCPSCQLSDLAAVSNSTTKKGTHSKIWGFPLAQSLHLGTLFAEVNVIPTDKQQIRVMIEGDFELVESAQVTREDSAVIIKAPIPFKPGTYIPHKVNQRIFNFGGTIINSVQSVSIASSGQIIIDNREVDQERKLRLTIEVPHNITLTLRGLYGTCRIGRVDGFLTINKSQGEVFVESTQHLRLESSGNQLVEIGEITGGEVVITNSGNGPVSILKGSTSQLHATSRGNGNMSLACSAKRNHLYCYENGNISVFAADGGSVDIVNKGNGKVTIASGEATKVDIVNDGNGQVRFDGTARQANLRCYGNGSITISEVRGDTLKAKVEGNGNITVDSGEVSSFDKNVSGNGSITFKGITYRRK